MPASLEEILTSTRRCLPDLWGRRDALERAIRSSHVPRPSFKAALRKSSVAVIAEVKRRSPSAGIIREDLDPGERAALYASHGAAAISVLTDGPFFGGCVQDLRLVVMLVGHALPPSTYIARRTSATLQVPRASNPPIRLALDLGSVNRSALSATANARRRRLLEGLTRPPAPASPPGAGGLRSVVPTRCAFTQVPGARSLHG